MSGQKPTRRRSAGRRGPVVSLAAINRLARRQCGLITRAQLLRLGVPADVIDHRVKTGRLTPIRRGVYRFGAIRHPLEAEMAAILSCGPSAVLSHASAASLHNLPHPARSGPLHVTVVAAEPGRKPGIQIHRAKALPGDETTHLHRIPVTTPARTILDLARTLRPADLEQLIAAAHRRRPANTAALHTLIGRYAGRPGVPAVRAMLDARPRFTRSKAERRLLEALRRAGFDPEANARVGGYEADLYLPESRLAIEIDGGPFHSSRPDRRRDYARDAALGEAGVRVVRFDADEPVERMLAVIARATR